MASKVKVDTIEQQGSSGIVLSHDVKLASGTAIKKADGTDLLSEAGALGSSVTGKMTAKAWVNFNGGVSSGGLCTVRSSFNVTSVTDTAAGNQTINLANAFASTDDAAVVGWCNEATAYVNACSGRVTGTTTIQCLTSNYTATYIYSTLWDSEFVHIIVFGD